MKGLSALLMHNERLADPLDPFVQALSEITAKRKKSMADHEEIGHVEFLGGLYTSPPLEGPDDLSKVKPCIPAWNVIRCLQDGAKRQKRGTDVLKGIFPLTEDAALSYDGPSDPKKLWQHGGFSLRKSVGVQRNRTMRTRPMFPNWEAQLAVEIDPTIFDLHTVKRAWADAGAYSGIGDMRPVYGRFEAGLEEAS